MQQDFISILALSAILTAGNSCSAHDETIMSAQFDSKKYLVNAEKKATYSVNELKRKFDLGPAEALIKYSISTYRLTYLTKDANGNEVTASGAIMVPEGKDSFAFFNYNHGTIFPYDEWRAPGNLSDDAETEIGNMLASTGYVVMLPDYIGYGSTKNLDHPYCAYNLIATSVVDMMKAVREFSLDKGIALKKNKNFFAGWSEGGGVTMAVVKLLEEQYASDFPVTAAAPMAGAYYSTKFADYVVESKTQLQFLRSYAWVLQSYNKAYGINKPLSYYFNEPYAKNLTANPASYTTLDPQLLFTKQFRQDYLNNKIPELQKALELNDLWNWKPNAKILLCHGENDNYVPLFNSEKAYEAMKEKGADVKLVVYKGKGHSNAIKEYITTVFLNFSALR